MQAGLQAGVQAGVQAGASRAPHPKPPLAHPHPPTHPHAPAHPHPPAHSHHPVHYVCIYASQVASCIGANRHRKVETQVETLWERLAPDSFHAALVRNGQRTEEQAVRDLMQRNSEVRRLVSRSEELTPGCSQQVASDYEAAARELGAVQLDREARRVVDETLRRNLYTGYGTRNEEAVLRHVRERLGIPCVPDDAFYKKAMGEVDGVPWYVSGKIDGITEDRSLLLEFKTRINRLFYRIPIYEQVQVQAYLELLDMERGALVECFTAQTGEVSCNILHVERDRAFWERAVHKLRAFVAFLLRLLGDRDLQDRYLRAARRSAFVHAAMRAAEACWGV